MSCFWTGITIGCHLRSKGNRILVFTLHTSWTYSINGREVSLGSNPVRVHHDLSHFHWWTCTRARKRNEIEKKSIGVSKRFIRNRKACDSRLYVFSLSWRLWVSPRLRLFLPLISFFYFVPITSNSSPWTHNKINSLCCKPLSLWK